MEVVVVAVGMVPSSKATTFERVTARVEIGFGLVEVSVPGGVATMSTSVTSERVIEII